MDGIDIAAVAWMSFNYAVLCPSMMFFLYLFSKIKKSNPMLKYRDKTLIYMLNVMMLLTLLCERLYANCVAVWSFIDMSPNWLFYLIFSVSWWSAFFLFGVKVFNLYYKQQYSIAVQDVIWKKGINPNINENWFIINKNKYGNPAICIKIAAIPFILLSATNTIIAWLFGEGLILDMTQYIIAAIPMLFSFVMCYKSRGIKDIYNIRNEIVYQCVIITAALFVYLGTFLYYKIMFAYLDKTAMRMEWLWRNLVAQLCAIGLALISTVYPLYLVRINSSHYKLKQAMHSNQRSTYLNSNTLAHIMSHYESYKALMQYLISEFSTESLLFLTELIMIKHQIYNGLELRHISVRTTQLNVENINIDLADSNPSESRNDGYFCCLYDNNGRIIEKLGIASEVPISAIVTNNKNNLEKQMKTLYNKYIKPNCECELNISSKIRKILHGIFECDAGNKYNTNNKYELFNIMDKVGLEILSLLSDPFYRFVNSDLFHSHFVEDMPLIFENLNINNQIEMVNDGSVSPESPTSLLSGSNQ